MAALYNVDAYWSNSKNRLMIIARSYSAETRVNRGRTLHNSVGVLYHSTPTGRLNVTAYCRINGFVRSVEVLKLLKKYRLKLLEIIVLYDNSITNIMKYTVAIITLIFSRYNFTSHVVMCLFCCVIVDRG